MEIVKDWPLIKSVFKKGFTTCFHYAIASVDEHGNPHVTPIGSLILGRPGKAIFFEKFTKSLVINSQVNPKICILAVNSSRLYWIKSLIYGGFKTPPALRLYGEVGALRDASEKEIQHFQRRVKLARITKGYQFMWKEFSQVRDIHFTGVKPVSIGEMTKNTYRS